jgi:subtilisin family serine protease
MLPLELVGLTALTARTKGDPGVRIGLIDGPVFAEHPDFVDSRLNYVSATDGITCKRTSSAACAHGTFVAGVLVASPSSVTPGICPGCTLLIRPIFRETITDRNHLPSATSEQLAAAILDCVDGGARVINLSLNLAQPSSKGEKALDEVFNHSARRGIIIVAAAGNQGAVGSSAITRHPWVISVVGCDSQGRPTAESNLGRSIGRYGLAAPGENIVSLGPDGKPVTFSGTSAAAPFVTGTIALLWSEFPSATATLIKLALTQSAKHGRRTITPPLLDAWSAYGAMSRN